jgi:hypothetical protein
MQQPPDSTGSVRERRTTFEQKYPDHEPGSEQQGVERKKVLSYAGKIHADLATQACIEKELKAEAELAARRRTMDKRDAEFARQLQAQLQKKEVEDLPAHWETFVESDQVQPVDDFQFAKRLQEEEDLKAAYDLQMRDLRPAARSRVYSTSSRNRNPHF